MKTTLIYLFLFSFLSVSHSQEADTILSVSGNVGIGSSVEYGFPPIGYLKGHSRQSDTLVISAGGCGSIRTPPPKEKLTLRSGEATKPSSIRIEKSYKVIFNNDTTYLTQHEYYAKFLLVPCWLAMKKCDICDSPLIIKKSR